MPLWQGGAVGELLGCPQPPWPPTLELRAHPSRVRAALVGARGETKRTGVAQGSVVAQLGSPGPPNVLCWGTTSPLGSNPLN